MWGRSGKGCCAFQAQSAKHCALRVALITPIMCCVWHTSTTPIMYCMHQMHPTRPPSSPPHDHCWPQAEVAEHAKLIQWRRDEPRVRRVLRFSPHHEVMEEPDEFRAESGLSAKDRHATLTACTKSNGPYYSSCPPPTSRHRHPPMLPATVHASLTALAGKPSNTIQASCSWKILA